VSRRGGGKAPSQRGKYTSEEGEYWGEGRVQVRKYFW